MSFNSLPPELTAWIISNVEELEKTELPFSGVPKINISRSDDKVAVSTSSAPDEDDDAPADSRCRRTRHWEALHAGEAHILYFRSGPTEALERVWVAAARAVAAMSILRAMTMKTSLSPCPRTDMQSQEFGSSDNAPGNPHFDTGIRAHVPQLHWTAPNEWRMSKGLQAVWRRFLGSEGEVTHEHW
ncbi:hypothetical protein Q7P35_012096 [Cladosporium inversicolor]